MFGVLGPSSDEADASAPLINAAKIPMFADTGEASFDHNKLPYFWRMVPADDVRGYAMALYAKEKGYLRAAAVFGDDIGSQAGVLTLLRGYSELGGNMVLVQKITLGQSSISRRSNSSSRRSRRGLDRLTGSRPTWNRRSRHAARPTGDPKRFTAGTSRCRAVAGQAACDRSMNRNFPLLRKHG